MNPTKYKDYDPGGKTYDHLPGFESTASYSVVDKDIRIPPKSEPLNIWPLLFLLAFIGAAFLIWWGV